MYTCIANQIIALLDAGQDTQARTLFMTHLAAHCRQLDRALSTMLDQHAYTDDRLWEVFLEGHRLGWFSVRA